MRVDMPMVYGEIKAAKQKSRACVTSDVAS
jgi:hypothetical protein